MPDRRGKYSYYDTPDGQDGHKKVWYVSKSLAKLAALTGTLDAFIVSNPSTRAGVLLVYARHFGALVGTGLAYTSAAFISTDLRHKDDQMNHIVGALAASAVVGSALSNPWAFASMALITSPMAYVGKTYQMNGQRPFEVLRFDKTIAQEFPTPNWHYFEVGSKDNSMKQMYEEKNEEFYKQRESSV